MFTSFSRVFIVKEQEISRYLIRKFREMLFGVYNIQAPTKCASGNTIHTPFHVASQELHFTTICLSSTSAYHELGRKVVMRFYVINCSNQSRDIFGKLLTTYSTRYNNDSVMKKGARFSSIAFAMLDQVHVSNIVHWLYIRISSIFVVSLINLTSYRAWNKRLYFIYKLCIKSCI